MKLSEFKQQKCLNKSLFQDTSWAVLIQARMRSSRLYGKILLPLGGVPAIVFQYFRFQSFFGRDRVWVILANDKETDVVADILIGHDIPFLRGSEVNVLDRYLCAAIDLGVSQVVRATSDDPLTDLEALEVGLASHIQTNSDYTKLSGLPLGAQEEIVSTNALKICSKLGNTPAHFEHVVDYILDNECDFLINNIEFDVLKNLELFKPRMTLDTPEDYQILYRMTNFLRDELNGNLTSENIYRALQFVNKE